MRAWSRRRYRRWVVSKVGQGRGDQALARGWSELSLREVQVPHQVLNPSAVTEVGKCFKILDMGANTQLQEHFGFRRVAPPVNRKGRHAFSQLT